MQIIPNSSLLSVLSGLADAQKNKSGARASQTHPAGQVNKSEETQDARRTRLIEEFRAQREQGRKAKAQNLSAPAGQPEDPLSTYNAFSREAPKAAAQPQQTTRPGQIIDILV